MKSLGNPMTRFKWGPEAHIELPGNYAKNLTYTKWSEMLSCYMDTCYMLGTMDAAMSRPVLLKVWSLAQQHWHYLNLLEVQILGPFLQRENLGSALGNLCFNKPSDDSDAC